jgi:hypothetical protein
LIALKFHIARLLNHYLNRFDIQITRTSETWRSMAQLRSQPQPGAPAIPYSAPFLKVFGDANLASSQRPYDFAVVMATTLRPTMAEALRSVFRQNFGGTVQTLIGLDFAPRDRSCISALCQEIPSNHVVLFFYPGYSTSRRHGGLHPTWDGGVLRTALSYLAHSRHVAYLDDDNWWDPSHLASMREALSGNEWAYAYRWFVHPESRRPICKDDWESIGPGRGTFTYMGGWVDPNCLAIDKLVCEAVLRWWSIPLPKTTRAMDADRNVFRLLSTHFKGVPTNEATVFYAMDETDAYHAARVEAIGRERYLASGEA